MPKNARGFSYKEFKDAYDKECRLSQSSAIDFEAEGGFENPGTSFVWLGIVDANPQVMCSDAEKLGIKKENDVGWQPYPIPDEVLISTQMHLNRKQVKKLITDLQKWLDTGKIS
jgi:hypothetical protein